jgi:DNA topoisomerase-1
MTEVDGKATGWRAFYRDGKWQAEQARSRAKKK